MSIKYTSFGADSVESAQNIGVDGDLHVA